MGCIINNEPGVAVVMIDDMGDGKMGVMPLFVAIMPGMVLTFPGEGGSGEDGGGPKNPCEAFEANKTITSPAPS
jgi:hypothetical protein